MALARALDRSNHTNEIVPGALGRPRLRRVVIGDVAAISRFAELETQAIGRGAANHELSIMDCLVVECALCRVADYAASQPSFVEDAAVARGIIRRRSWGLFRHYAGKEVS